MISFVYDVVGTLAECVDKDLNRPDYIAAIMPCLITLWNTVPDDDRTLCSLLECLTAFANSLRLGFLEMAPGVYARCIRIIEQTLLISITDEEEANKEFIICAVDLISGLTSGLGENMAHIIAQHAATPAANGANNSDLRELLFHCMRDYVSDVRQSAFALVGDLSKNCFEYIRDALPQFLPILIQNLSTAKDPTKVTVCNNATWAIGEIAVKYNPESMAPFINVILDRMIDMINFEDLSKSLLENVAIALGRLGLVCPEIVAPRYQDFLARWCVILCTFRDDIEKDHAFRGLINLIRLNPNGAVRDFMYLADAICSWKKPKDDLAQLFYEVLLSFKEGMGANWERYFNDFPPGLKAAMKKKYNI